jgi:uncharacterized protein YigA (DUF484 family)
MGDVSSRQYLEEQVAIYRRMIAEIEREHADLLTNAPTRHNHEIIIRLHNYRQSVKTLQDLIEQLTQ